jgi:sulfite reductase (NADPH) hemoprotein beta-component
MYVYDEYDHQILNQRVAQFRDQTARFLAGELPPEQFLPLRLQNGLYVQRLAPMLRINVPYGMLNSTQLRRLAHIARHYDKGYAHVSTRQNIQFNWPDLFWPNWLKYKCTALSPAVTVSAIPPRISLQV